MPLRLSLPAATAAAALCSLVLLPGCQRERLEATAAAPPAPVFQGPRELRGTIGSYARLQGGAPLLVSGYGLVVNLDRTGSGVVPEFLRDWLSNEMRKRGVGSRQLAARNPELAAVTPQRLMYSEQTAVVRISGFIPAGATPGTPFDLLLEALPEDTDTTSLAGGQLWRTGLGVDGANRRLRFSTPLAAGAGPVYLGPEAAATPDASGGRRAVIVGGGRATEPRRLELILNQSSWVNARRIADTINERYRAGASSRPGSVRPTANAVSDSVIQISVPERFVGNAEALLALIENTYPYPVDRADKVDEMMALLAQPAPPEDVLRRAPLVCRALGPNAIPALRAHYAAGPLRVRQAALDSGAWLGDHEAVGPLASLAASGDPATRRAAAASLALLPDDLRATEALAGLLDDADDGVRIAAYEAVAGGSALVERTAVENLDGVKFLIDRVPAERPLVLAIPRGVPRLVIFGPQTGFTPPVFDADPAGALLIRTPTSFAQAMSGLRDGDTAFLPAVGRTQVRDGAEGPVAEALDAEGAILSVELGGAAEAFASALPLGGSAGGVPATLRCRVEDAGRGTVSLLGLEPGLGSMPLSIFYRGPGGEGATTERVAPTVAALAFFLAHRPTMGTPQEGLDLSYGRTVSVLERLARGGSMPSPMRLLDNPLAARVAEAEAAEEASRAGRQLSGATLPADGS
ncbi:flagellar basal body P-ring protein FlgI [Phycisphaera mikurensis]|uniref:Flagellar basal body P-ring protein n=1 Tax=Phycisphaera mikurensis (strain NBRC 102666 / KCTC 22515 / FYK2301M01) TaxID=1142394 RepID=I0IFK3_PHYMF|nr:flagellar basal body P-ring protein FlgI [Phycisphaera mikurensis]MBB6440567.1 hypothetical protein [Phycisphaera mikurensis]BAM04041.1 hypothetical protein PSMK_18820 [Phycisphaera mikurensis NBRC 102666]